MKKLALLTIFLILILTVNAQTGVIFKENFEGAGMPAGWSQQKVLGLGGTPTGSIINWKYLDGGYFDYPEHAYQGSRNAMFNLESYFGETTKLITPPINILDVSKPELRFAHVQEVWEFGGIDYHERLKVYYKKGLAENWVLLASFDQPVYNWIDRTIQLPDSSKSSTYYIAFEGIAGYGYGTCIDTVRVIETGIEAKYLYNYNVFQATTNLIATSSDRNPILGINMEIRGNDGNLFLDSLKITSLNTNDSDLKNNGVKLYVTADSIFRNPVQLATGVNFVNGVANFKNINYDLPRGFTTVWITYDVATAANHDVHNHIADAKIGTEHIYINGFAYPFSEKSPSGQRLIKETIIYDSFETDLGWILSGFERGTPLGLGVGLGYPDPTSAYTGTKVIGNDLTSDGLYANDLTDRQLYAISPTLNCRYYRDVTLFYARWLNIEFFDKSYIDISTNNKSTWNQYWINPGAVIEDSWALLTYNLSQANFKDNVNIRYALGATNSANQYSGWNIDDFIVVGDFISRDVGVSEIQLPITGCGHTTSDQIRVKVKNYAGEATNDTILIRYSIDNSPSFTIDTIFTSIPVGDSTLFTFDVGANLSAPGSHLITVKTLLTGDEITSNDTWTKTIFSYPTISLPYSQNFESNNGYYLAGGRNSSWAYGVPTGTIINSAASGTKAWVTNLSGTYSVNDSSFLESPCFNFAGTDSIIFEFKCKGISEDQIDGLTILYSLNEGANWNLLPNHHYYYWNWYNETNISQLELPGIDETSNQWLTFRQLLPAALSNQSSVKFRFVFESNATNNYEGFGIDDIKIYAAPYDVGVEALTYPFDRCEWSDTTHVKISVKNYGPTAVKSGTKIPLVLKFNSTTIRDTLALTSDLAVNTSKLFTFNNTVDMSYAGSYNFTINTKLESNAFFYNETVSNDTLYATASVTGMPRYNPFPILIGDNPIDTFLVAGQGYVSYDWNRAVLPDTTALTTDTLFVKDEGWYKVTVTNGDGCTAIDSVEVVNSEINLTLDTIYTELVDSCERNILTEISIRFINNSINDIDPTDTIPLAYQVNDLPMVKDTLFAVSTIAVGNSADFTFAVKADFITPDNYTLKAFIDILKDLNHADDTLSKVFKTKGYVNISFAEDSIYSSNADTVKLSPTPLYSTYLWSNASTNDTITNLPNISQWYKVTVSDAIVCSSDIDSIYVETYDFGINSIVSPINACSHTIDDSIRVFLHNYSGNTYNPGTKIPFRYNFNNLGYMNDTATLGSAFGPGVDKTVTLSKTIDPSTIGNYNLKILINAKQDANGFNDTIDHDFETWGYPNVDLAYDTIFTTRADTIVLVASPGLFSYLWNTGSTNDSLIITDKFSKKYYVTASNEHPCGTDSDTTWVMTYDLGVNSFVLPKSACSHTSTESVRIAVKNFGQDIYLSGSTIPVGYIFNGGIPVHENFILNADLDPGKVAYFTFNTKIDLESIGTYTIKSYTRYTYDVRNENDSLHDVIKTFGYPTIEIGSDIYTAQPETLTLVAPAGYNFYKWNTGETTSSLPVTYPATKNYVVTVTDINGCSVTDNLTIYTYNVAADSINAPIAKCNPSNSEPVIIGVKNTSKDTLQIGEPLEVGYRLNGGAYVSQAFTLTSVLKPDSISLFTMSSTVDISLNQLHQFKVFAKLTNIDVNTNDTTLLSVDNLNPNLDLGADVNTSNPQYIIDAGPGYASYLWQDASSNQSYTVDINNQTIDHIYSVTVTTATGCSGSDQIVVTFDITPDLSITDMSSPYSECWQSTKAYPVVVTIRNSGAFNIPATTPITVGYRIGNGTPVIENIVLSTALNANQTLSHTFVEQYTFTAANLYTFKPFVKYPEDIDASNDTLFKNIDISQPNVSFNYDTIYFTQSATISPVQNFATYLWDTGSQNREITVTTTGTYTVTVTDGNGCSGSGKIYCEKGTGTGIDNMIEGNGYSITYYPNPASDKLLVQFDNSKSTDVIIELINTNGQILYKKQLNNIQNTIERIDVNKYAKGVYYIRFKVNNEYYNRKVVIQ